tara:strand:+ start:6872 stop:7051 length:180 start_codon:yes stop_codon:yes gene_type:complete
MNKYAGSNRFAAQGLWDKKRREEGKTVTMSKAPWEDEKERVDIAVDNIVHKKRKSGKKK